MRDIKRYGEVYSEPGFEKYQIYYRRKKLLEILSCYSHKCVVEIGVGPEPLFQFFDDYEQYYFFEPAEKFYQNAMTLLVGNVCGFNMPFYMEKKVQISKPDFIICSSLLHEVEEPVKMLRDIWETANENTVVHMNVPNANSIHRLLAKESGIIDDVTTLTERNILLQQNGVFDMDSFVRMVEDCGFRIIAKGSYFIKPFTHDQMQRMLDDGIIDERILDGLYNLINYLPDLGSEIYVNAVKK